jgi:hypothetical protein
MVQIEPVPLAYLKFSRRWWPTHPPVFPDGPPTSDDIAEARALYEALDPESQWWYRGLRGRLGMNPLTEEVET